MKKITLALFSLAITFTLQAQANLAVQVIDASAVPQAVLDAQASHYPSVAVRQWKKQTLSGPSRGQEQYLASFTESDGNTRVRYTSAGKALVAYTTLKPEAISSTVKSSLNTAYPGHKILHVGKSTSLVNGKMAYRAILRKGGQKLTVWLNASGTIIDPDNLPEDVVEEGNV